MEGSDPAGGGVGDLLVGPCPQDVQEKEVQQSGQHRLRARASEFRFHVEQIQCRTQCWVPSGTRGQVDHVGQLVDQEMRACLVQQVRAAQHDRPGRRLIVVGPDLGQRHGRIVERRRGAVGQTV
ncbi:hypothetical protein GCM10027360_74840 [Amycolatopsis echigonensis]|nr:hypothetical protein [Amycolatopsis echigonensis]